jgi:hypothetical protein
MTITIHRLLTANLIYTCENAWSLLQIGCQASLVQWQMTCVAELSCPLPAMAQAALLSLPARAIAKELVCVARPPPEGLKQSALVMFSDALGTGRHLTRWRPWKPGPHRVHFAVEGRIRLQHGD